MRWGGFAQQVAPLILDFYGATSISSVNRYVLDLCCGTGQLAVHFLERGYSVIGVDWSEHMLRYAREHANRYIEADQARFIKADATNFTLDERFGLVVSTYDSLNHLADEQALRKCFECVFTVSEGFFIFDLNTRAGLRHRSGIQIDDSEEMLIIANRLYDGQGDKAWTRVTGFLRAASGLYERFDETAFNTIFDIQGVGKLLSEVGWTDVYYTRVQDLTTPIADPENEGRVFIVASK
jgi:SAM-dependent methyltransferase